MARTGQRHFELRGPITQPHEVSNREIYQSKMWTLVFWICVSGDEVLFSPRNLSGLVSGECKAQRLRLCFSTSSPGFISWLALLIFSKIELSSEVFRNWCLDTVDKPKPKNWWPLTSWVA